MALEIQLIDLRTAAKVVSVSPRTIQRWIARGLLPTVRIGGVGKRLVGLRDLKRLIARSKEDGGAR